MRPALKILVTAIAGGLTYLLTNTAGQPEIWQLTMSVFVGGIVLVVQVLIDYGSKVTELAEQQRKHASAVRTTVDSRFSDVSAATALYGRVEASGLRKDEITRLAASAAGLGATEPLLRGFIDHEITRLAQTLDGLRGGWAYYEGEDRDWLLGLTECTQHSIDATSLTMFDTIGQPKGVRRGFVDEGGFWATDLGQRCLDRQQQAIQDRGVKVRRLFLLDDESAQDTDQIEKLMQPHRSIGVDTRLLRQSDLDPLLQPDLFDFILFDGVVSYELSSSYTLGTGSRPLIASVTLVVDRRVAKRKQRFERMWQDAKEL